MSPLRSVPEAVLLRQRRVGHPFCHWLSFLLPAFVTELMLQTRFFSCPIPLLPNFQNALSIAHFAYFVLCVLSLDQST